MKYEIKSKDDFLTGSYLITSIPDSEVDKNALHTIQADCPDFILPVHYKRNNGQIELIYKIGTKNKLLYFAGDFTPKEYIEIWQSLLKPLLECGDWFMSPSSFVLDAEYLYYDKNKKSVSYVYIPSAGGCCGYDTLHKMAVEVSKMMTVSDAALENKVLRSIMRDFSPEEFLKMLKDHLSESETPPVSAQEHRAPKEPQPNPAQSDNHQISDITESSVIKQETGEDILIDIQPEINSDQTKRERENGGYRIFSGKSKRQKVNGYNEENHTNQDKVISINGLVPVSTHHIASRPDVQKKAELIEITQNTPVMLDGPGLRYIGRARMPQAIGIKIIEGEIFTIGRFDATVGKKQSSFEFDKKTKAVSRRHAVIERDSRGYKIIDLSSSAGTFVNDKKLPPNTPHELETGCRVSFGNSGADYVWEVSYSRLLYESDISSIQRAWIGRQRSSLHGMA